MAAVDVMGVLGGIIITIAFVGFVIILLKIIRVIMVKGVRNQTLSSLLRDEEDGEDLVRRVGADSVADSGGGDDSSVGGAADVLEDGEFWENVDTNDTFSYPSPARLAKSTTPSTYIIRSSVGNKTSVYNANGASLSLSNVTYDNPIQDARDARLFLVHYFDLAHFEPSDKEKPVDERSIRYVVFESAVLRGFFIHYETLVDVYMGSYLKLTNNRPPVEKTVTTDDRFFKMRVHDMLDEMNRSKLLHMATDQWLSVGSGIAAPTPVLRPTSSGASDVDLFFVEETLVTIEN